MLIHVLADFGGFFSHRFSHGEGLFGVGDSPWYQLWKKLLKGRHEFIDPQSRSVIRAFLQSNYTQAVGARKMSGDQAGRCYGTFVSL